MASTLFLLYRRIFYSLLVIWSGGLFVFTIIRLVQTLQPREKTFSFFGMPFYDPTVAELCFCGLITLIFSIMMLVVLTTRTQRSMISRNWFEVIVNAILSIVWLGGAAAASAIWRNLNLCSKLVGCRILAAMLAFAWIGWAFIVAHLTTSIVSLAQTGAWDGHIYERAQRPTMVDEESSYMEQKAGSEMDAVPWSYHGADTSRGANSFRLSSFSAFMPWIVSSGVTSERSSLESSRGGRRPPRKVSRLTIEQVNP